jgi:hypothetical protein
MHGDVDNGDGSVALYADTEELVRLAHQLRAIRAVEVELEIVPVAAQLTSLRQLVLEPGAGDVAIRVAGNTATLSGDPQAREWLAREFLEILAESDWTKPGMHVHFDAGTGRIAPASRDLMVWGPVEEEPL